MRVAFIFPPAWAPWAPSYGMALLAASARKHGHAFLGFDLNIDWYRQVSGMEKCLWQDENVTFWLQRPSVEDLVVRYRAFLDGYLSEIVAQQPDLYAFSVQSASAWTALSLAAELKQKDPQAYVLFGGPDCFRGERGLAYLAHPEVDAICTGEADVFWPEFLNLFDTAARRPSPVPGLVYRDGAGTIADCGDPVLPGNLDGLPHADYAGIDFGKYTLTNRACVMTSRGCINRCSYCSESPNFRRYRHRSASGLFAEVRELVDLLRANSGTRPFVNFSDSLINGRPEVLRQFCQLVIDEGLDFNWGGMAFLRPEMDRGLLSTMKRAGCCELMWGLESGSDAVLALMRKGRYPVAVAEEIIRTTQDVGISQCANFIVGFPGETEPMFLESAMFLLRNRARFRNFGLPLMEIKRNTAVFERSADFGIEDPSEGVRWKTVDGSNTYELRLARRDLLSAILGDRLFDQGRYASEFSLKSKWSDRCRGIAERLAASGHGELVLCGAGEVGRALVGPALRAGVSIKCIADRNASLWGQAIDGVPVCGITEAAAAGADTFFIASFSHVDEIRRDIETCYGDLGRTPVILWDER